MRQDFYRIRRFRGVEIQRTSDGQVVFSGDVGKLAHEFCLLLDRDEDVRIEAGLKAKVAELEAKVAELEVTVDVQAKALEPAQELAR